jgi:hypothetical protein
MSLLFVGQGPAKSALLNDRALITSDTWRRLAVLCGTTPEKLTRLADTINILPDHMGRTGKWDKVPPLLVGEHLAVYIRKIVAEKLSPDLTIVLGRWAADAYGLRGQPYLVARKDEELNLLEVAIPHPGGTNMWYNTVTNREHASNYLALALDSYGEPGAHGELDLETRGWRRTTLKWELDELARQSTSSTTTAGRTR